MRRLKDQLARAPLGEPAGLVGLALVIGVVGGLGAVAFRLMIRYCQAFFVGILVQHGLAFTGKLHPFTYAITPAIGLILVGVISNYFAREVKGHGVPQILESLALRGGRIRPRVGLFGILAPAITIGSRGSVGREGPIALIGASFGSSLGQMLKMDDAYISLLVGCGAAAGIGATFNAPIGGGLFGLEVVLGSFAMGAVVPAFVSSITAVLVFRAVWGDHLVAPTPLYQFAHPGTVALVLVVGVLAGLVALAYTHGLHFAEHFFDAWPTGWAWKAAAGGLVVGILGLVAPQVLGVGYGTLGQAVIGKFGLLALFGLLIGKYLATVLTIGGGGSGGVFAPSLFLGAMLGGTVGEMAHLVAPALVPHAALFAVAGLGAVFAGAAQAPLTAIVIILEMTGDYHLTVGVIGACVISYLLYGSLARDSMYTVKLSERGVRILRGAEVRPLQQVPITAAMQPVGDHLTEEATVAHAREVMARERVRALPIFGQGGRLVGILDDLRLLQAAEEGDAEQRVGPLCRTGVPVVPSSLSLDDAMRRFGILATDLLPVGNDPSHVVGTVSRDDALRVYYQRTVLTLETRQRVAALLRREEGRRDPGAFREFGLPADWVGRGLTVSQLDLPGGVVVVSVRRAADVMVPRGDTVLQGGDRLLVYGADPQALRRAEAGLVRADARPRGIFGQVEVPADWAEDGTAVAGLGLPDESLLVAIRRQERLVLPHGSTVVHPGDVVTIYARDAKALARARGRFVTDTNPQPEPASSPRER